MKLQLFYFLNSERNEFVDAVAAVDDLRVLSQMPLELSFRRADGNFALQAESAEWSEPKQMEWTQGRLGMG
jgi:hypothetical protein